MGQNAMWGWVCITKNTLLLFSAVAIWFDKIYFVSQKIARRRRAPRARDPSVGHPSGPTLCGTLV